MLALPYYKEEWFDIPEFEGLYQVSTFLNVRNLTRKTKGGRHQEQSGRIIQGKIMKPYLYQTGYYAFEFYKDGKCKHVLLHRIIAETFIPNQDNLPEVDHINRVRTDNRIENLRWVDRVDQNKNRDLTNSIIASSKQVAQYDLNGNLIKVWDSMAEATRNGFSASKICLCCQGKRKTHKKSTWKYV